MDFVARLAKPGTMLLAAVVIAFAIAFIYEHSFFGTLQYVTAFAFYLAVMMAMIPVPALLRGHGRYHAMNWLVLAFALLYAGNAVYVGRWQSVALLAAGGAVIGLLVGVAAARRREPLPQS